ncbi:hypothetical protein ZIOFF_048086 [Zingiber officinale]|uniref:DUF7722 domain-containing protein n=1 Tax=Zingiber officinale TaxID=94328 RepID=A0A8J5FRU6_ZINOF|nr:hypothetical protein ZIOFF_048086 [Zingiber officinale]
MSGLASLSQFVRPAPSRTCTVVHCTAHMYLLHSPSPPAASICVISSEVFNYMQPRITSSEALCDGKEEPSVCQQSQVQLHAVARRKLQSAHAQQQSPVKLHVVARRSFETCNQSQEELHVLARREPLETAMEAMVAKPDHNAANFFTSSSDGGFHLPVHYPRYNKDDYEAMPEWELNRLLVQYGLPVAGDLTDKRGFAIGAFVWPPSDNAGANDVLN